MVSTLAYLKFFVTMVTQLEPQNSISQIPHSLENDSGVKLFDSADIIHDLLPQKAWLETQAEINKKAPHICKHVT